MNTPMAVSEIAREVVAMADHARQERGGEDSDIERLARKVLHADRELNTLRGALIEALDMIPMEPTWPSEETIAAVERLRALAGAA